MLNPFSLFRKEEKGVKVIPLSDFHTGGSTALFPYYNGEDLGFPPHKKMTGENGGWKFKHGTYIPSAKQYAMFKHFTACAKQIEQERGNNRFVVVQIGDATDGDHHKTPQLATRNIGEQNDVHVWLMQYFLHHIGFDKQKGDLLYYGQGTEVHDGDEEDSIAQRLGAETLPNGDDTFDFMPMDVLGNRFWFLHQGAPAGKDLTLGNALHNYMRNKYFSCLENRRTIPSVIVSGHYHNSAYDTFTRNDVHMHGIVLPPWQLKTRFGYRIAAAELEGIGTRTIDVSPNGDIKVNKAMLLKSKDDVVIV